MPKVWNVNTGNYPNDAVLIDRTTEFGNLFIIGKDGDRKEVISKHIRYVDQHPELKQRIKEILYNKDLLCHCAPKPCHGDYLLLVANSGTLF